MQLVWTEFPKSIRVLLDNQYVFADFWRAQSGAIPQEEFERAFAAANHAAHVALGKQDTVTVLSIVLSRIYTLRNQLVHGGATWGSSVNREQLRDCTNFMAKLVPLVDRGHDGSSGDVVGAGDVSGGEVRAGSPAVGAFGVGHAAISRRPPAGAHFRGHAVDPATLRSKLRCGPANSVTLCSPCAAKDRPGHPCPGVRCMQLTPELAFDAVRLTHGGSLSVATLRHRGCAAHRPRPPCRGARCLQLARASRRSPVNASSQRASLEAGCVTGLLGSRPSRRARRRSELVSRSVVIWRTACPSSG